MTEKNTSNNNTKALHKARKVSKQNKYLLEKIDKRSLVLPEDTLQKNLNKRLVITILPNNVFCNFSNIKKNTLISRASSHNYGVKTTKKTLKFACKHTITEFLQKNKKNIKSTLFVIKAPTFLRKLVINIIGDYAKKSYAIDILPLKCYNGCKARKSRKKKGKGFRIFK